MAFNNRQSGSRSSGHGSRRGDRKPSFGNRSGGSRPHSGGSRSHGNFNRGPRRFNDGPKEMHKAVCAQCQKECEVPFKPTGDRPVYCRECFQHRQ